MNAPIPPKKKHGLLLFSTAVLLTLVTTPFGILFSVFKRIKSRSDLSTHFMTQAIEIDQTGNLIMKDVFNATLITKEGCSFGNPDETISSVLGKNEAKGTLTKTGKALVAILHKLDPNHAYNSIDTKLPCEKVQ